MTKHHSLREAALVVLRERGPMHYQALTDEILERGLATSESKTPAASLNTAIVVDIQRNGRKSEFIRLSRGVYGLRALHGGQAPAASTSPSDRDAGAERGPSESIAAEGLELDETQARVRTPQFPLYSQVRHLLRIWPGRPRKQVTGLQATLRELRGTPQATVDWTDPDAWIPERLQGDDRELAQAIWTKSRGAVNPRHTYGHWLLCQQYRLVEEGPDELLRLSERGREFVAKEAGETEAWLDEQEGVMTVLALVADNGPARAGDLSGKWTDYLNAHSRFRSPTTMRDALRRRLSSLFDRGYVERAGSLYSVTETGLAYLRRVGTADAVNDDEQQEVWERVRQQETTVRESLREILLDMDPFAFEHLVKRLLDEMNYQNAEVTKRSGDGGVDVVADIELGITSVREVVQAKRYKTNKSVQRKDLDALRGSLYRFNAVRGTLITTSRFARGAREAAFANGVAPITLIDGDKLIDLLIEYGVGVRKRPLFLLELDTTVFAEVEQEA